MALENVSPVGFDMVSFTERDSNGFTSQIMLTRFDLAGMQGSLVGESGANLRSAQATVDAISGGSVLAIATPNCYNLSQH